MELALANYKKALKILPNDTNITDDIRTLIENGANTRIDSLKKLLGQSSE